MSATMSRRIRTDPVAGKRMRTAALLFAAAMLLVGGSLAWTIVSNRGQGGEAGGNQSLAVCCSVLFVLAASANVFVAYGRLRWFYRCPQCRARVPRVPEAEAGPRIRYRCAACGVEWDTGWDEIESGD
jgi:hypothetical protein